MTYAAHIPPSDLSQEQRLWLAVRLFVLMKVAFLIVLAVNTRFVMDEFWHFTQPVYLFDGTFETIWPKKAVGYAVFYELAHLIGWDSTSMLLVGRLMTAGIALALCWCIYQCARALGYERVAAVLAVALLLCFSNFIERGFRLRSEPLATLFAALAILVVIRYETNRAKTLLLAGLLSGLAFVTTQKSVYFNFALGAALVVDALCMRSVTHAFKRGSLLCLGWVIAIATYGATLGGQAMPQVLELLFLGPAELALNGGSYYEGLASYVRQTLFRNVLLYGLVAFGVLLAAKEFFVGSSAARIFFVFTALITALVFFHNQTWPYVFIMALPFLAIYGAGAVVYLTRHAQKRPMLVPGLLMIIAVLSTVRNVQYLSHDNRHQIALIQQAEGQIAIDETYFDGIGMIPSRRMEPRLWLDAQAVLQIRKEGQDSAVYQALLRSEPDLVISTYRTDNSGDAINSALKTKYGFLSPYLLLPLDKNPDLSPERPARAPLFSDIYAY